MGSRPQAWPVRWKRSRSRCVAHPPQWFAVQTRYRFEKRVVAQLNHKSCEVYLPLLTENHTWSDRQKVVTTPLFPGYAFVHIDHSYMRGRQYCKPQG